MLLAKLLAPRSIAIGIASLIILIFCFSLIHSTVFVVDSGQRALVLRMGNVAEVVGSGPHVKLPFADRVVKVDVRTQRTDTNTNVRTKDQQNVSSSLVVNYHLSDKNLDQTYARFGLELKDTVIAPRVANTFKAVVAKYSAEELLKLRDVAKSQVETELRRDLATYNIVVESVMITDFKFSEKYNDAIERKQIAEQSALSAVYDLNRIKTEADQKLVTAKAEAEATRIQSEALKAQGGADYVQLQAINKWDGKLPSYMTGSGTPFVSIK